MPETLSETQVMDRFAQILAPEPTLPVKARDSAPAVEPEAPAASDTESPPKGEDDAPAEPASVQDGQADEEAAPPIDPPASWSSDAKEIFSKVPPEYHGILREIVDREAEREKAVNQKFQEAATRDKAMDAEREATRNERNQYAQGIEQLRQSLNSTLNEWNKVDWQKLAAEDPAKWTVEKSKHEAAIMLHNRATDEQKALRAQQETENTAARAKFAGEQIAILTKAIPAWKDVKVFEKELGVVEQTLQKDYGITAEETSRLIDARFIQVARDAMKYRELQKTKPGVTNRVREAPRMLTPGAAAVRGGPGQEVAQLQANLMKNSGKGAKQDDAFMKLFGKVLGDV